MVSPPSSHHPTEPAMAKDTYHTIHSSSEAVESTISALPTISATPPAFSFDTINDLRSSIPTITDTNYKYLERIIPPLAAGTFAFYTTLALSTFLQLRVLRVSTGSLAPLPSVLGIGTVALASAVSHVSSVKGYYEVNKNRNANNAYYGYRWNRNEYGSLGSMIPRDLFTVPMDFGMDRTNVNHFLRVCIVGLLAYKTLGGRFWSISPSSYTNLGSFARTTTSLPATSTYANKSKRRSIQRLGRILGCHTCGSRMIISSFPSLAKRTSTVATRFTADHMPPQSVTRQMNAKWYRRWFGRTVKQRFYPHCNTCSNRQGGVLSAAVTASSSKGVKVPSLQAVGGGKNGHFHGFVPRIGHLAGGVVGAVTTLGVDANDGDEVVGDGGGNRRRFYEWQRYIEESFLGLRRDVDRFRNTFG